MKREFCQRLINLLNVLREMAVLQYKTYIRPHMEFCVQSWSPHLKRYRNPGKSAEDSNQVGAVTMKVSLRGATTETGTDNAEGQETMRRHD